jgi:predicted Zn-dependent peptidase
VTKSFLAIRMLLLALLLLLPAAALAAPAGRYTPDELHRYEVVRLPNGFSAILNPRAGTRNVSIYLVVDVGLLDFDCRDRELPHLAEHLMFSGTSTHTESELDSLIDSLGGRWNAWTSAWSTTFWLSIHHAHAYRGLDTLHAMITDTQLNEETLRIAKDVVHQESGGHPGWLKQLMYRSGVVHGSTNRAYRLFVPGSRAFCRYIDTAAHLSIADVGSFLDDHYAPENMTLVVVGAFEQSELIAWVEQHFGGIPARPAAAKPRPDDRPLPQGLRYDTRFAPVLGSSAQVGLEFAIPHRFGPDKMALSVLASYLDQRMFEVLRVERGLGYAPTAAVKNYGDVSMLALSARVEHDDAALAGGIIEDIVDRALADGVPSEELERIKRGKLLRLGNAYETNASIAAFYAGHLPYFREHQRFPDLERLIAEVDAETVHMLAIEFLRLEQALRFYGLPTITYTMLSLAGAIPLLGLVAALTRRRFGGRGLLARA